MVCSWEKWSSKGCDWWAGFDGFDGLVASSGVDRSGNDDGAACFVDFDGSTKERQRERLPVAQVVGFFENWRNLEDGCSEADHAKRNSWIQKSETGG